MGLLRISFCDNQVMFSFKDNKILSNFINSNTNYNNELLYSFSYVKKNVNIIKNILNKHLSGFLNVNAIFDSEVIFDEFFYLIQNCEFQVDIIIKGEISLSNETYKKLTQFSNLNSITCYFMPENYVHFFALRKISVYFLFNESFSKKFVIDNDFKSMKDIYYKKNVILSCNTFDDFIIFLKVNRCLKIIHIYEYSSELMEKLFSIILHNLFIVLIHQNDENKFLINKDFKKLKKYQKKYKKCGGDIKIIFSDDFFQKNLLKQLTYGNLKICSAIIIYLAFVLLISNSYNDYVTWFNANSIMNSLSTNETTTEIIIDDAEEEPILPDENESENPYNNISTNLQTLLSINEDTVGWIKVNNTKINYPVTQSKDNDYYLNRDFYLNRTANGWIFMDYRNNANDLDKNTIIYGHALLNGYMFGDLRETIKSNWYKNEKNLYVTFNTIEKDMVWEIFSIYRVPYTTDYLKVDFFDDDDFSDFIDLITSRSVYNFGVKVNSDDFILTLSTCSGNDNGRLVLHAKLVK